MNYHHLLCVLIVRIILWPIHNLLFRLLTRAQLLKVLETRKTVLQKEQSMAFARAVAAGFDIDNMAPLMSFAEAFGASRLRYVEFSNRQFSSMWPYNLIGDTWWKNNLCTCEWSLD